jgi:RHS repeat-associated protein
VGYGYDGQGRMKTMTNWSGFSTLAGARVTTWNYDAYRGFLTSKTYDGGTAGPAYTYTSAGRLLTRLWARGTNTTYSYNTLGEISSIAYNDGNTPSVLYGYDRRGRQTTVTNGATVCTLSYNDAGELLSEAYTGGPLNGISITNGFDAFLRRTNLATLNSSAPLLQDSYTYDAASRLQKVSDGVNSGAYSYLANSPLVSQIAFTNNGALRMTTSKSYDNLNRLTSISSSNATPAVLDSHGYAYNNANQRTSVTNADGTYWIYQYDNLGQVISGVKYWSDNTVVAGQQFGYNFDTIGNRTSTQAGGDQNGANLRSSTYTANNLNQYSSRTVPAYLNVLGTANSNATVSLNITPTYRKGTYYRDELAVTNASGPVYLSVTNLAVLNNGTNADIITNITGNIFLPQTPENFAYDADGNLTNDGRWTYTWDAENRLISMTNNANVPSAARMRLDFIYDYQGRRVSKATVNGSTTNSWLRFVYDGWNLENELNGTNNAIIRSYMWGTDLSGSMQRAGGVGGLLAISSPTAAQFTCFDGNGNVTVLIDATNSIVTGQYEYAPYGEIIRTTGPTARLNPIRFSTKYQDDETDLLFYGYRYLNPTTGKWLNRDPMGELGGLNLYAFCSNASLNEFDALGQFSVWSIVSGVSSFLSGVALLDTGIGFVPGVILIIQGVSSVAEGITGENPAMDVTVKTLEHFNVNPRTGERIYHGVELVTGLITIKGLCKDAVQVVIKGQREITETTQFINYSFRNRRWVAGAIKITRIETATLSARILVGGKTVFDATDLAKNANETVTIIPLNPGGNPEPEPQLNINIK